MKDIFDSFIAIRNLALINYLIRMNLSLFTTKIFEKYVLNYSKLLTVIILKL